MFLCKTFQLNPITIDLGIISIKFRAYFQDCVLKHELRLKLLKYDIFQCISTLHYMFIQNIHKYTDYLLWIFSTIFKTVSIFEIWGHLKVFECVTDLIVKLTNTWPNMIISRSLNDWHWFCDLYKKLFVQINQEKENILLAYLILIEKLEVMRKPTAEKRIWKSQTFSKLC